MTRPALLAASVALFTLSAAGQEAKDPPQQVRVLAPPTLAPGTKHLVHVEGLYGNQWKALHPDSFKADVKGAGKVATDPAGRPMNPFELATESDGKVTVSVAAGAATATRTFPVAAVKPAGSFELAVNPAAVTHPFAGLGAGVLFYDNQFGITSSDDVVDWCFKDVNTSFLHVLIRPDYEKQNDNDDWRKLDPGKFDFKATEAPFRIIKKALERNPGLKIYASLYTPPAWMKANDATGGQAGLKDGPGVRQEVAEYVYAYLKHAKGQGIPVHYLAFFNEPDYAHTQDGTYFADFGQLAETFAQCAAALDTLTAADPELKASPVYVFADTLGAGSVTRGPNALKLRERAALLEKVGVWGVHDYYNTAGTYWNTRYAELRAFPPAAKKPVWMTEWAQRYRRGDLASGVEYGAQMLNAVRLGAEAWMAFEWMHPSGNQSGLLSTDWGAKPPFQRYWRSKAYHVFRQVANTTPGGSAVVSAAGKWAGPVGRVEYLAVKTADGVAVHLTNTEPVPVRYKMTVRKPAAAAEGWVTGPLTDMAAADPAALAFTKGDAPTAAGVLPANTTLSVVFRGAKK